MCIFAFSSSLNFFFVGFHSYCLFVHSFCSLLLRKKRCVHLEYFVILVLKSCVCIQYIMHLMSKVVTALGMSMSTLK